MSCEAPDVCPGTYPVKKRFEDVESDLERGWNRSKAPSGLAWAKAKGAARDAWDRIERAMPGDFDKDGK